MENFKFFGGRVGAFCTFLGFFLLLCFASAREENEMEPTANVNLGPIQKWRSAYFCLKHKATEGKCAGKKANFGILTPRGELNVSQAEVARYCSPGDCADHIRFTVLKCIFLVHKGFKFANKANITYMNNTIATQCADTSKALIIGHNVSKSSGKMFNHKTYVSLVSALLVFVAIFNM